MWIETFQNGFRLALKCPSLCACRLWYHVNIVRLFIIVSQSNAGAISLSSDVYLVDWNYVAIYLCRQTI